MRSILEVVLNSYRNFKRERRDLRNNEEGKNGFPDDSDCNAGCSGVGNPDAPGCPLLQQDETTDESECHGYREKTDGKQKCIFVKRHAGK